MSAAVPVGQGTTPTVGLAITTSLSLITIAVQAVCISQRLIPFHDWTRITLTHWLILIVYVDSMLFVLASALLSHGFGLNSSQETCSAAILLCLVCYLSSKLIYYFLVEKAYIVNRVKTPRLKSKLYWFNCFAMLVPYSCLVVVNFVYRIARFDADGMCIIGMERQAMIPLVIFDVVVNVYLTALFIIPLRKLHSFKTNPNSQLRVVTVRTFIGSCCTLTSSVTNLTVLMILHGEPAWICLMICNADILFSVLVLHWITNRDTLKSNNLAYIHRTVSATEISDFHRNRPAAPPADPADPFEPPDVATRSTDQIVRGKEAESVKGDETFLSGTTALPPDFSWKDEVDS